MDPIELIVFLMAAIVGGGVAWRYATWNLYRRPGAEWATDEIHPKRINRRLLARRKRHRLQITAMAAVFSPMLLYVLLVIFEAFVELSHTR
jgi:hypothetical protein